MESETKDAKKSGLPLRSNPQGETANPLIFLNISDPKESKRHDNKKTVRRWAMLNRKKTDAGDTRKPYREQSTDSEVNRLTTRPTTPLDRVGLGHLDPFASISLELSKVDRELIDIYLQGVYAPTSTNHLQDKVMGHRHKIWFPMIRDSPASFHSTLAVVASSLPAETKYQRLTMQHVSGAVSALNDALRDKELARQDSTILAIFLLLKLAKQQRDFTAMQLHLRGIAAMLHERGGLFAIDRYLSLSIIGWGFYGFAYSRQTGKDLFPPSDPAAYITKEIQAARGYGFSKFPGHWRTPTIDLIVQQMLATRLLADRTRAGDTTAVSQLDFLRYLWSTCYRFFAMGSVPLSDWEHCCRFGGILLLFIDTIPSFASSEDSTIAYQLARSVYELLSEAATASIFESCTSACMWISLVAGTFAEGEARVWFSLLLRRAADKLEIHTWEGAIVHLESFFWSSSPSLEQYAKSLWIVSQSLNAIDVRKFELRDNKEGPEIFNDRGLIQRIQHYRETSFPYELCIHRQLACI